uniref:Uncharacterized protein n=1 Tax=Anguilla anguilla TaxID=7936 RepID=A0A0E9X604_ANGAN
MFIKLLNYTPQAQVHSILHNQYHCSFINTDKSAILLHKIHDQLLGGWELIISNVEKYYTSCMNTLTSKNENTQAVPLFQTHQSTITQPRMTTYNYY